MSNVLVEKEDGFLVEPFDEVAHLSRFGFLLPGVTILPDLGDEPVSQLVDQIYG